MEYCTLAAFHSMRKVWGAPSQLPGSKTFSSEVTAVRAYRAPPPDLVLKLFEHKGSLEEYRTYKNNLVFLVADGD